MGALQYDKQTGQDPKFPLTGGVDLKYGLSSNLVLNLTGNTDFADTEVDLQPFNLSPFRVFIPEKRQFFLENAGVLHFDLGDHDQLFFSRQIGIDPITGDQVPINGGAKLTGTLGRMELGIMDVDTRSNGPNPFANFAVVRLKESLWSGSYIGVMGIDKRSGNVLDSFNQTGGVDTRLVFFKDWVVDAHMAGTESPGHPSKNSDLGASLTYRSNWLDGIVKHRKIGPNFNPEVGFVKRTDSDETYGDLTFKIRPRTSLVREFQLEALILHAPNTRGEVSTQEWRTIFTPISIMTATLTQALLMSSHSKSQHPSISIRTFSFLTGCTTSLATHFSTGPGKTDELRTTSSIPLVAIMEGP